ncbi:ROK family protein [Paenibacillus koleovorans]|uniref:ROK family protein n=1 Tax=Paenibacillus koleovorans TaxID=121608 RepID=UPI000FDBA15B|nr:ROK family protein [Paenibacillus koleovorans]
MRKIGERITNKKAKELFAAIRKKGIVSKIDLLEQSDLTSSTLTRMLDDLCANGWIEECGHGESSGGRRPVLYRVRRNAAYAFGLDISRASSRLIVCDMQLDKLDSIYWDMTASMTPTAFVGQVVQAVESLCRKHGIAKSDVLGLGIGAVGPLDRNRGLILNPLHFPAPGWNQVPIVAMLEQALSVQVTLDNGANTALLAEYWAGAPNEYRHLLYVRAGVGLRSAMISDGNLVYGAVDMEGSIGHMIIQTDGRPHPERSHVYGCLESYVSIPVLEEEARAKLKQGRRSLLADLADEPDQVDFNTMLQALRKDDPMVTELFLQAATYFGIGLSNLLNTLHPERVILGGPLITSTELFYQTCTQVALKNTLYYPAYPVSFSRGRLSDEALALGAAAMIVSLMSE